MNGKDFLGLLGSYSFVGSQKLDKSMYSCTFASSSIVNERSVSMLGLGLLKVRKFVWLMTLLESRRIPRKSSPPPELGLLQEPGTESIVVLFTSIAAWL